MILKLLMKDMDDIYENIDEYNPNKKLKILIALDDNNTFR